ncbi:hypothetical protein ACFL27_20005 [candidate division CSSED10-310 bacterium]|uniref:Twin-arginine translocase TatA/TatE family subunit n=1 Tax=candidate division CSSED10-310 bacterium TaxID=2855610 RepID=A0ABV6Z203_UNCC1
MESFTYVNIFEMKGVEYLLVLFFLALLIFLVRYFGPSPGDKGDKERII